MQVKKSSYNSGLFYSLIGTASFGAGAGVCYYQLVNMPTTIKNCLARLAEATANNNHILSDPTRFTEWESSTLAKKGIEKECQWLQGNASTYYRILGVAAGVAATVSFIAMVYLVIDKCFQKPPKPISRRVPYQCPQPTPSGLLPIPPSGGLDDPKVTQDQRLEKEREKLRRRNDRRLK